MKIAIEGCAHGELEIIYDCIEALQEREGISIDLLICCGDFQSVRNQNDLRAMAVPQKFYDMRTFYKYYSGEKKAPILTIFIGGNHEASNYLQELPYGGWVAPNIYYMGRAGVVRFGNLRIGGLSGIFKKHDYLHGLWESPPYSQSSLRSVYHVRAFDVYKLSHLKDKIHVMLSHDWPRGITDYGDVENLLKRKKFLREDIQGNQLGSMPSEKLLHLLRPDYWFAAHLHCQFAAIVHHDKEETKFLALDKCLPKRKHLQVLELGDEYDGDKLLKYDVEWLAILKCTNHLLSVKNINCHLPGSGGNDIFEFTPSMDELENVHSLMGDLIINPSSFVKTAPIYIPGTKYHEELEPIMNPQTVALCEKLGIDDPLQVLMARSGRVMKAPWKNPNESVAEAVTTDTSEPVETKTPIKCSKLSLPEPVTPMEDSVNVSQRTTFFSQDSSCVSSFNNSTSDCSTPQSVATKKIFKRRNLEMYSPATDEATETSSSNVDGDSPRSSKYVCRTDAP